MITKKLAIVPIVFGIIFLCLGLLTTKPGLALTTYSSDNGKSTYFYEIDNKLSTIDEYVGGDAYNFIISAILINAKYLDASITSTVYTSCSLLCFCVGIMMFIYDNNKEKLETSIKKAEEQNNQVLEDSSK